MRRNENRNGLPNYSDLHPLSIQPTAAKVRRHFFISMKSEKVFQVQQKSFLHDTITRGSKLSNETEDKKHDNH